MKNDILNNYIKKLQVGKGAVIMLKKGTSIIGHIHRKIK